jgi:hypothetical protein
MAGQAILLLSAKASYMTVRSTPLKWPAWMLTAEMTRLFTVFLGRRVLCRWR